MASVLKEKQPCSTNIKPALSIVSNFVLLQIESSIQLSKVQIFNLDEREQMPLCYLKKKDEVQKGKGKGGGGEFP